MPPSTLSAASPCPISVTACLLLAQVSTGGGEQREREGSNPHTGSDIILLLATSTLVLVFTEHLCNESEQAVIIRAFGDVTE